MKNFGEKPIIVVNFKDYEEARGEGALNMAVLHEKVAEEFHEKADVVIAVHPTDLRSVAGVVKNVILISESGQSCTRDDSGNVKKTQTGRMTPNVIFGCGAMGFLINHAENPVSDEEIRLAVSDFKTADKDCLAIVCAESVDRALMIEKLFESVDGEFWPDFIAIEPPELIGGDVSVTTRPEIIEEAVAKMKCKVLVGAGVKTEEDVEKALELGAGGVLLASGVIKPKEKSPEEVLKELILSVN